MRPGDVEAARRFAARIPSLKTMPAAAQRVLMMTRSERTTTQQLAQGVALDPNITSQMLRYANSAYYGMRQPVRDIVGAIIVLGFRQAAEIAVASSMTLLDDAFDPHVEEAWRTNLLVASAASRLARALLDNHGSDETFVAALLHDIGRTALRAGAPELYVRCFRRSLRELDGYALCWHELGFHPGDLGGAIVELWNLAPEIADTARHHTTSEALTSGQVSGDSAMLLWMVLGAKLIAHEVQKRIPADIGLAQAHWLSTLGPFPATMKERYLRAWKNVRKGFVEALPMARDKDGEAA